MTAINNVQTIIPNMNWLSGSAGLKMPIHTHFVLAGNFDIKQE